MEQNNDVRIQVNCLRELLERTANEIYIRADGMHLFPSIEWRINQCWDALVAPTHTRQCMESGVEMDPALHAFAPYVRHAKKLEEEVAWILQKWIPVFQSFFPSESLPIMYADALREEAAA